MTGTSGSDESNRQALLELLLAEEGLAPNPLASIRPRPSGSESMLSYSQERLWFLQQFASDTSALANRTAIRFRGPLDVDILRHSLDALIVRHSVLRTLISTVDGEPKPHVVDTTVMPFVVDDLRTTADGHDRLAGILDCETHRTFDLASSLPILCRLIRLADDDHVLSVVIHHVASDGWSFSVFHRDLRELYAAHLDGRPAKLPDLPIEFADYAAWQRTFVSGENLEHQLHYWRDELAGAPPICEIPTDFVRPPMFTFEGGQVEGRVEETVGIALRALAAEHGATPFMVLFSAFDVLLSRRMDRDDIVIGTPVAGRVRPELGDLIGMFVNTLVFRTDLSDDPTFSALVTRVRDTTLGAFDNQDVSFEHLLAELQPPRDLSRTPLFQVFFNMIKFAVDQPTELLPGLRHEVLAQDDIGSKFDLTLYVIEDGKGFDFLLVYNRGLYRPDTMRQLVDQYMNLLQAVVADPSLPVSRYSLITSEARERLPDESVELDATWHGSVPASVRRVADLSPEHTAVIDSTVTWSYGALAFHMDRIAASLRAHGIGKGHVVAIYGHRSASLVCAVTGVLAAGAGYLLLDPRYPPERLAKYLRIARPDAWIELTAAGSPPSEVTDALDDLDVAVRRKIPALPDLEAEAVGEPPPDTAELTALSDAIGPDDLACLTFTSGSTGDPKAVMGRHGSLTHFLPWQSERFDVGPADRFSMLSGLAHDPIQRDIFWALWVGATIVAPDPDEIATPGWLAEWMRSERITVAHLTPAMGQLIAEVVNTGRDVEPLSSLRRALFIGDVLTRRDVEQFRRLAPDVLVVNLYGTTETQRASGYHVVDPDVDLVDDETARPREVLPLGVGIPGTQLLVRSDHGAPAGFGEIGEIWFRSPHLALGYLDRPEDTTARFHDPSADDIDSRYYRTGDRGRYLPDGEVAFLGRHDDQVQIRGFRVELGEIRAAIVALPGINDAVVQTRSEHGSTRIIAYVVPRSDRLDPTDLRRGLRSSLPGHMVPTDYVLIPSIPLTPNGKLDRAALPAPQHALDAAQAVEPRDQLERRLVELWEQVLGRTGIGIHDNFFDLGGYSLLATRLFAMIEADTGRRIAVSALFEAPTIADLAEVIRGDEATTPWTSLVPVQPKGTQRPFFYVAPYRISVLQLVRLGDELGHDQPLYGFQPQGLDGAMPAHDRVEDMATHYIREMRQVQPYGPYRIGGHCSGAWVAFEMARQLEAAGEHLEIVVLVDHGPPNPGPLNIRKWHALQYRIARMRFNNRDGRLLYGIKWKARRMKDAVLLRRTSSSAVSVVENVKAIHHAAYQHYEGGTICSDIAYVGSDESLPQPVRDWYQRWGQKTTGEFQCMPSIGTRVDLLDHPYVDVLAERVRWAFGRSAHIGEAPERPARDFD